MGHRASVRNYMELLRDLSNSKGRVAVSKYASKHHVSQAITVSLGKLGYVKSGGGPSGSVWVGPRFSSEEELRTHADLVMKTSNKYNLDALRKRTAERRKAEERGQPFHQVHARPTEATKPVKETPNTVTVNIPTRTVSILWGLFTFSY